MTELIKKFKKPPYDQGLENMEKVLRAVRWFGHLRHTDLAKAVWPLSSLTSGVESARRTCKRLIKKGYLAERRNTFCSKSLVLTQRGAQYLTSLGLPCSAGSQLQNVTGPFFKHRTMTTQYLLERRNAEPGDICFGEYAIHKGWFDLNRNEIRQYFGKMPDALVVVPGHKRGFTNPDDILVDWVETESSFKSMYELQKVMKVAWSTGGFMGHHNNITLDRLIVVVDILERHEPAIARAFKKTLEENPIEDKERLTSLMENILIVRADTGVEMRWKRYEVINMIDLLRRFPDRKKPSAAAAQW